MILMLNTSKFDLIALALVNNDENISELTIPARFAHQENIIKLLDKLLSQASIYPQDITGIIVVSGPGSFSALRLGLAVANTLAWQLNIPIVGVTNDKFSNWLELYKVGRQLLVKENNFNLVLPVYGQSPNINIKK